MAALKFKRVNVVPSSPYDPSTLYIVKASTSALVELYFSSETGATIRRVLTESDVAALIAATPAGSALKLETARLINGVAFDGTANITINAVDSTARIAVSDKGVANGVASLDSSALVPVAQIPQRFDNIYEGANVAAFPAVGSSLKIYIDLANNELYRWDGVELIYVSIGGGGGTIPDSGITPGEYPVATYNIKGQATNGRALVAGDIPNLPGSKITTSLSVDTSGNAATATKLATARTINGQAFDGTANITINAVDATARIATSEKGAANGVATLDATGKIPSAQLPSYVDDILEVANFAALPVTGETGKIYVTLDDNKTFRWTGSVYVRVGADALTADTAVKLATPRNIAITGDGAWNVNFDGSANVTANLVLATVNASPQADTFRKWTVNGKGQVTASSAVGAADITTALGFTPVNKTGDTMTGGLVLDNLASGDQLKLRRTATQYMTFNDSNASGAPVLASYSDSTNAKIMTFNVTTDAGNTVLSGGALGYAWQVYGATVMSMSATGQLTANGGFVGNLTGLASGNVVKTGDTMTGDLTITKTAPVLTLNATNAGGQALLSLQQSGSTRWTVTKEGSTESGGNAGSNLQIRRYDDAGVFIDAPVSIDRATGDVTLAHKLTVTEAVTIPAGTAAGHAVNKGQIASLVSAALDELLHPFMFLGVANAQ